MCIKRVPIYLGCGHTDANEEMLTLCHAVLTLGAARKRGIVEYNEAHKSNLCPKSVPIISDGAEQKDGFYTPIHLSIPWTLRGHRTTEKSWESTELLCSRCRVTVGTYTRERVSEDVKQAISKDRSDLRQPEGRQVL